jgi:hypothetical protein
MEGLIDAAPDNAKLLTAASSGFTEFAYAFVQQDADRLDEKDPPESRRLLARAKKLYARARRYGMRGLEAREPGFGAAFEKDRKAALAMCEKGDVPLLYWTASAWAAQISISKDDATLLGDLPQMESLMNRALALDESWGAGSIHEFFISYDGGRPESAGGSAARAKQHFDRAVALSHGRRMTPYLAYAEGVCEQKQDKKQFLELVDKVLAFPIDEAPEIRLVNLIAQDRARRLKGRVDDLFAD